MIVRKLRLQRAWSQEQLAQLSGLNIRTIQRIERGQKAGLESLKSLAAVFDIELDELLRENDMNSEEQSREEARVIEQVKEIKGFYSHLITYVIVILGLFLLNSWVTPHFYWATFAALGWGIGLVSHGISVFEIFNWFGPEWERKQIEKRLGRKL